MCGKEAFCIGCVAFCGKGKPLNYLFNGDFPSWTSLWGACSCGVQQCL